MTGPASAERPARGLRVVMVAPTPFFSDRGCHVRILEEARGLMRLGADVTICTYFLGDTPEALDVRRAAALPGYTKRSAGPAWGKLPLDVLLWRQGQGFSLPPMRSLCRCSDSLYTRPVILWRRRGNRFSLSLERLKRWRKGRLGLVLIMLWR